MLKTNELVSVIMPVYNAEKYLCMAIDSILNQTYSNIELLIADDASTDDSLKIINSYNDNRIKCFHNIENRGYLETCNNLFANVSGNYITFQDADDFSKIDRIEKLILHFELNKHLSFLMSHNSIVNIYNKEIGINKDEIDLNRFATDINYTHLFCGATIIIKKEVLLKVGFYRQFYNRVGFEDYDWLMRIVKYFKGEYIKEPLYIYRLHDSAVKLYGTSDPFKYYAYDAFLFIRKYYISYGIDLIEPELNEILKLKLDELNKPYLDDCSLILKMHSFYAINRRYYFRGLYNSLRIIYLYPFKISTYSHFVYCIYIIIRRIIG